MTRIVAVAVALAVCAATASSAFADSGPVGLWHFDEGSGTVAADSSGYSDPGTLSGGADWVTGRFGGALSFNGTTSEVRVVDKATPLEPANTVSASAWVKHSGTPGAYSYILAKGAAGCIAASYALFTGANGGLAFYVSNGQGHTYVLSPDAGTGVWDGNWHFVVGTFDGTNVKLYVDGTEVGTGTPHAPPIGYSLADSNDLYIGNYLQATPNPDCHAQGFVGSIDEAAVWDHALTAAQVSAMMPQPNSTTPETGGPQPGTSGSTKPPAPGTSPKTGQPSSGQPAPKGATHKTPAPALARLKVSPSGVPAVSSTHGAKAKRKTINTISYIDSQTARTTFTVLLPEAGATVKGRCVAPTKRTKAAHARGCTRYRALGSFTHADRIGVNHFQFTGLAKRRLAPHRYRLDAVPVAHGVKGRTVSTVFTVVK